MLSTSKHHQSKSGFTLVEMLVIAPVAMLAIAAFIGLMVTMVGDVIASRNRNTMTYEIQSALNTIEQDVRLTTQFMVTSGSMLSPQGKNDDTTPFQSTAGDLVLGAIATDKNPIDPTRGFVYYNAPFLCSDPTQVFKNRIFFTTIAYFVKNGSLWRRTYVPNASGTLCTPPWQVNTCSPGYASSATRCQTNDSEIMKHVKTFSVEYFNSPDSSLAIGAGNATTASTIRVLLEGEQTAAGRTFDASGSTRITKLSSQDVTQSPPNAPTVSGTTSGRTATFTWPSVPTATSYIVRYNINGGDWITASENTTDTSFDVSAVRGDTVSIKLFARNAVGTSVDTSSNNTSVTIPRWIECNLQNGWVTYNVWYETCGYTMTKDGVVMFKGHIRSGSTAPNTALFQLPPDFRPSQNAMFQMVISPNTSTRVDVNSDGWVRLVSGSSSDYVGLDGITFIPRDSLYRWSDVSLQNGWTAYGGGFPSLQRTTDASGRVHLRGTIKEGTFTSGTVIAQLPAGSRPDKYYHLPARGGAYNLMGVDANGYVRARGISSPYLGTQAMFYPSGVGTWHDFITTVAGDPADNQLGNNWVSYGTAYPTPGYTKSADGVVTLRGLIMSGSTVDKSFIARLPEGYCPFTDKTLAFSLSSSSGVARVDVARITGQTSCYIIYRAGSNGWFSLNNISYLAE